MAGQGPAPIPPPTPGSYMGQVGQTPGSPIVTPNIAALANDTMPQITSAEQGERANAAAATGTARASQGARELGVGTATEQGIVDARQMAQRGEDIAAAGKADVAQLPEQVKNDIQGIADSYKRTTDVDIGKIESLGREAVGMAMEGKNAAAEAAVQAQQASTRSAISQINADPSIPQSRKTAMIAQIQTNSSMQIASTIGANIKDFTTLQTNAMAKVMDDVGSAMTARNQTLGVLGGAEIGAVASAHETAANISKGYDDLQMNARENEVQARTNYGNLRETSAQMNDEVGLQMLNNDYYVSGMPLDHTMLNLQTSYGFIKDDFAMGLQGRGMNIAEQAVSEQQKYAQLATFASMFKGTWLEQILTPILAISTLGGGGGGGSGGGVLG